MRGVATIFKRFLGWSREVRSRVALSKANLHRGENGTRGGKRRFLRGHRGRIRESRSCAIYPRARSHEHTNGRFFDARARSVKGDLAKGKSARVDRFRVFSSLLFDGSHLYWIIKFKKSVGFVFFPLFSSMKVTYIR